MGMNRCELLQALLVERYAPTPPHVWDTKDDYQERVWDDSDLATARRRRAFDFAVGDHERKTASDGREAI